MHTYYVKFRFVYNSVYYWGNSQSICTCQPLWHDCILLFQRFLSNCLPKWNKYLLHDYRLNQLGQRHKPTLHARPFNHVAQYHRSQSYQLDAIINPLLLPKTMGKDKPRSLSWHLHFDCTKK